MLDKMKGLSVTVLLVSISLCQICLGRAGQRRNSRLMNWKKLTTDIQEKSMPDRLASNNSLSEITRGINNKLQDLKLVKERSSKNINEDSDLITGSKPQEANAKNII